jgi:hypothetical protein
MIKELDKSPSECSGEEKSRPTTTSATATITATPHEIIQAVHQVLMEYFERVPIGGLDGVALAPDEADSLGSDVVALLKSQKGLGGRSDV